MHRLDISGFRNIERLRINPDPNLNVIVGDNAAGKTSVLEAVYYLSRVRSFRTQHLNHLIMWNKISCHVFAQRANDRIGVARNNSSNTLRLNGSNLNSRTPIAERLPIQLINTEHQRLLLDGPKVRRQFLDWGAFHIDHEYRKSARRFHEALRQRNAALRGGDSRMEASWIPSLASSAAQIDQARRSFITAIQPLWRGLISSWLGLEDLQLDYRSSAPADDDWLEFFNAHRERDMQYGYTCNGPHRADLRLSLNGIPAAEALSRGQQKLLVVALLLAEVQLWAAGGLTPLLLIDDLAAELDSHYLAAVMQSVSSSNAQVFMTAIEPTPLQGITSCGAWYRIAAGALDSMV